MRVCGCKAYVRQETSSKLETISTKCIFVGYPKDYLGYYFYIPNENKIFISRKDNFLESKFLMDESSGRRMELEENHEPPPDASQVGTSSQHEIVEPEQIVVHDSNETQSVRRSDRIHQEPKKYKFLIDECLLMDSDEPINYQTAISNSESDKWLENMKAEMQSMHENHVWTWLIFLLIVRL